MSSAVRQVRAYLDDYSEDPLRFYGSGFGQVWMWGRETDYEFSSVSGVCRPSSPPSISREVARWEGVAEALRQALVEEYGDDGPAVFVPIYAYVHSGVAIRSFPFGDPWDSGLAGCAWASRAQVQEEFGSGPDADAQAEALLEAQVQELSSWIAGDCWIVDVGECMIGGIVGSEGVIRVVQEEFGGEALEVLFCASDGTVLDTEEVVA